LMKRIEEFDRLKDGPDDDLVTDVDEEDDA
jgi:hypothetical protein